MTLIPVCSGTVTGERSMIGFRFALDGQALRANERTQVIERSAERVDDTPEQAALRPPHP